eukprot:12105023-Alexandrium_andersonii.AAC.1
MWPGAKTRHGNLWPLGHVKQWKALTQGTILGVGGRNSPSPRVHLRPSAPSTHASDRLTPGQRWQRWQGQRWQRQRTPIFAGV